MAFYVPLDIFRKMSTVFHVILSNSILIIYVIAAGEKNLHLSLFTFRDKKKVVKTSYYFFSFLNFFCRVQQLKAWQV